MQPAPLVHGFTYPQFQLLKSTTVQKYYMESSRNKLTGFKLCAVLSSMRKPVPVLLCPTHTCFLPLGQASSLWMLAASVTEPGSTAMLCSGRLPAS